MIIRKWFASFLSLFSTAPTAPTAPTLATQKANCLALADHLEKNVTDDQYDHTMFRSSSGDRACALGHAAFAGIGGMGFDKSVCCPILNGVKLKTYEETNFYGAFSAEESAEIAFGKGSYDSIFDAGNFFSRNEAITALRSFEPITD